MLLRRACAPGFSLLRSASITDVLSGVIVIFLNLLSVQVICTSVLTSGNLSFTRARISYLSDEKIHGRTSTSRKRDISALPLLSVGHTAITVAIAVLGLPNSA